MLPAGPREQRPPEERRGSAWCPSRSVKVQTVSSQAFPQGRPPRGTGHTRDTRLACHRLCTAGCWDPGQRSGTAVDGTRLLVSWRHTPPHGTSQPQRPLCRSGWCHPPRPLDPDFERLRRFSVSKVLVWGHSVPRVHPVTRGGAGEPSRLHTGQGGHCGAVAGLPGPLGEASLHFPHLRVLRTVLLTSCRRHLSAESPVLAAGRAVVPQLSVPTASEVLVSWSGLRS